MPEKILDGVPVISVERHSKKLEETKKKYQKAMKIYNERVMIQKKQIIADSTALELLKQKYPEIYWEIVRAVAHLYEKRVISDKMPDRVRIRQESDCAYCGISHIDIRKQFVVNPMTIDHIHELRDGGRDAAANFQFLCYNCHIHKTRIFHSIRTSLHPKFIFTEKNALMINERIKAFYHKNKTFEGIRISELVD